MDPDEQIKIKTERFRREYLKPDWDGLEAHKFFSKFYNTNIYAEYRHKPIEGDWLIEYTMGSAINMVFNFVSTSALSKEKLIARLQQMTSNDYNAQFYIMSSDLYKTAFQTAAKSILVNIYNNIYPFQHPVIE